MGNKSELIIQSKELLYPEILFNLPVNPLQRPHLTLWSGRLGRLERTSQLAETIDGFGWSYRLMAGRSWSNYLPPSVERVEYELAPNRQIKNYNLLEEVLTTDNLLLFGLDLEMSSSEQILAEKLLQELASTRLITAEVLRIFKTSPKLYQATELTIFASTTDLMSLAGKLRIGVRLIPDSSVYNKIELLRGLSLGTKRFIVFDNNQIIAFDSSKPDMAGIYNSSTDLADHQAIFLGLAAALLAISANNKNFIKSILTACYLIGQLVPADDQPAPTLKRLLLEYFD